MDPITPFGRKWEYRHSLWLNWLFGPFLLTGFISFLYIGIRTKKNKWIIAGVIYFIVMAQYFFYFGNYDSDSTFFNLSILLVCAGWVAAWVHAFQARREYLRIIALQVINDPLRHTPPYIVNTTYPFPGAKEPFENIKHVKKQKTSTSVTEQKEPFVININGASMQEIASHPYIGNILARQIVQVRDKVGEFKSFAHLVEETNMKPHIIAKAKPYIQFSEELQTTPSNWEDKEKKPSGSTVKKEPTSGRIVDY
ncbi:helix-hairpin-helix domain-containing protein [Ornithinibacillus sp. BX22]|uniref:Helix-hairpin-helix domain-containing protein n=2 Tax=Ornithinibacillus TaxID=484508 RepID=A0A923RFV4_9BACI|nr:MULTISPECIES: helix-hairpin-helix domain-containing protein [Ornithinibacillus]MBC5635674.1 helix-hairpin-helix domain-containing protein [Ornithinibacillus hominis]MBS3679285.1 helix-hairpin-helix domain-containing protein [Ornithinibacillus massiliensis]